MRGRRRTISRTTGEQAPDYDELIKQRIGAGSRVDGELGGFRLEIENWVRRAIDSDDSSVIGM